MSYFIGVGIVAAIGVVLWIFKLKSARKSGALQLMDTSTVAEIQENYESITASMGSGSFTYQAELKGKAHADVPLKSVFTQEDVVYYSTTITHEYEELKEERGSDGKTTKKWVKKSERVSNDKRWADGFGLKDATGFIEVNGGQSNVHAEKLYSDFEKGDPVQQNGGNMHISIKGVSIALNNRSTMNDRMRTIGYRYKEEGIRINKDLYIVGNANDRDGRLRIGVLPSSKDPFIVSAKSKDEVVGSYNSSAKILGIIAIIFWVIAAIILAMAIFK